MIPASEAQRKRGNGLSEAATLRQSASAGVKSGLQRAYGQVANAPGWPETRMAKIRTCGYFASRWKTPSAIRTTGHCWVADQGVETMNAGAIFHITSRAEVEAAQRSGQYLPAGFHAEGFIHCSYRHQISRVADCRFTGQSGLVLLEIETDALTCAVVDENLEGGEELFPHIYGALPVAAVTAIHDFPCREDGRFQLPASVGQ